MYFRILLILACAMAMTGCTTDKVLRTRSGELALLIDRVNEDAEKFVVARSRVMQARTATLTALEANALDSEQSNQLEISYHAAAGDTAWVALIDQLRKAPELVLQQRKNQEAAAASAQAAAQHVRSEVDFKTAKLNEASKAMATLAEEPDRKDVIAFYKDFFEEVQKSVEQKAVEASNVADTAESASKKKGTAATSTADTDKAHKIEENANAIKTPK